jgi:esterase/lipase superfamily enzyme
MSAFAFARVMEKFMAWRNSAANEPETAPCLKRINVLAHSMGNRVLRETLTNWNRYDLASGVPLLFRNTFLVAADIVNESLTIGQPGELIAHASRNVAVYFASDDLALRSSKVSNLKNKVASRRLGHTGPEDMDNTPRNVYAIDCDDFNNQYDKPTGHAYFLTNDIGQPGSVFQHILKCIQLGRVFPDDENRRMSILQG